MATHLSHSQYQGIEYISCLVNVHNCTQFRSNFDFISSEKTGFVFRYLKFERKKKHSFVSQAVNIRYEATNFKCLISIS